MNAVRVAALTLGAVCIVPAWVPPAWLIVVTGVLLFAVAVDALRVRS